jgi:hypothetical protein
MKNFLIIVLALGLAGAAFLTRPGREDFERFVRKQYTAAQDRGGNGTLAIRSEVDVRKELDGVEVKDFYLWTVVKRDGKTLYTGVFDHWIDNQKIRETLPS